MAAATLALISMALVGTWLWTADRGLDRVDESYVLAYIANPDAARPAGEVNLFGFFLHPLYAFVGNDIAAFRRLFVLVVAVAAAITARECLRCVDRASGRSKASSAPWLVPLTAAAVSLTSFTFGLRSPSYYTVVLVGLLVAVIGLCRALIGAEVGGAVLLAVGWWCAFLGKPTSAAALAVLVLIALTVARRLSGRLLVAGIAATLVGFILVLALAQMTPVDLVEFLIRGVRQDQLLGGHVNPLQLLGFSLGPVTGLIVFGTPIAVTGVAALEIVRTGGRERPLLAVTLIAAATAGIAALGLPALVDRGLGQQMAPLGLLILLFGLWAVGRAVFSAGLGHLRAGLGTGARAGAVLAVFLAWLPYVEAVGTNSPFTGAMSQAALFWMLAATVGVRVVAASAERRGADTDAKRRPPATVVIVAVALAVTSISVATVLTNGGPGASLVSATERVRMAGGTLWLPPTEALVSRELDAIGRTGGLAPSTPVVDLTGISAGYAYQLGGRSLGRASFMGVFPGAPDAAAYALAQNSCEDRARAWLLWAPDNPFDVSSRVGMGRRIPDGYEVLGRFRPVQGPDSWRLITIEVLRPALPDAGCP